MARGVQSSHSPISIEADMELTRRWWRRAPLRGGELQLPGCRARRGGRPTTGVSVSRENGTEPDAKRRERREAHLDEQEDESFPASDPHSDWAGPSAEKE